MARRRTSDRKIESAVLRLRSQAHQLLELNNAVVSNSSAMWSPVVSGDDVSEHNSTRVSTTPCSRCKHASVLHGQHVFLLGGRNGTLALKDFWKYNVAGNEWECVRPEGSEMPGCLQEHTMVGYRDKLYVFGGEVSFCNGLETPLWIYHITTNRWRKFRAPKGVVVPRGRRSHSATVFQDCMYVYGGYIDLKGSTAELWAFHFVSETWHLVSQGGVESPPPRHRHCAVLHDSGLWVYGGMTDLQERADFWRFDFVSRRWRCVKSSKGAGHNPGLLHSASAVKFLSVMMIVGGEREGQTVSDVWRFHFGARQITTEFWERLSFVSSQRPTARSQASAFLFCQFTRGGCVHHMGLPEHDFFGSTTRSKVASAKKEESEDEATPVLAPRHNTPSSKSSYHPLRSRFNYSLFNSSNASSTESINTQSSRADSPCSVRRALNTSKEPLLDETDSIELTALQSNESNKWSKPASRAWEVASNARLAQSESTDTFQSYCSSSNSSQRMLRSGSVNQAFYDNVPDNNVNTASRTHSLRLVDTEESVSGYETTSNAESLMSFANPNYNVVSNKQAGMPSKLVRTNNELVVCSQSIQSPADSLCSDFSDFHAKLRHDLVEMRHMGQIQDRANTNTTTTTPTSMTSTATTLTSTTATTTTTSTTLSRNRVAPLKELDSFEDERNELMMLMYVMGGREVGQVSFLKRPLSVWKLDLTRTF